MLRPPQTVTRWRAAGLHLAASALILTVAAALAIALWYPPSLFHVSGIDRLLVVLITVDLVVGPLLTLLVYRQGKPGMLFDLTVIALLQIAFFGYGAHVLFQGRPVFLVGNVDRLELVFANQIAPEDLAEAKPPYDRLGFGRPRWVAVQLPPHSSARNELLFEEIAGREVSHRPHLYRDYDEVAPKLLLRARTIDELLQSPANAASLLRTLRRIGAEAGDVRWLPLVSSRGTAVQLLSARDGTPIAILRIDPWSVPARKKVTFYVTRISSNLPFGSP